MSDKFELGTTVITPSVRDTVHAEELQCGRDGLERVAMRETKFPPEEIARRLKAGAFGGHYGGCPVCGRSEGPFVLDREDWMVCSEHRLRWCFGANLMDYLEGEWEARDTVELFLSRFQEIPGGEALCPEEEADRHER